jgi:hypothetical protein
MPVFGYLSLEDYARLRAASEAAGVGVGAFVEAAVAQAVEEVEAECS